MGEHAPGVALITGANRGLGLETAKRLAERGWRVIVAARDAKAAEKAARSLPGPAKHASLALDVTKVDAEALSRDVAAIAPALDALVNNAGVYGEGGKSGARNTIETNFFGPLRVTDALRARLARDANVVNVTSGLGELSNFSAPRRKQLSAPSLDRAALLALVDEYLRDLEDGHPSEGARGAGAPPATSAAGGGTPTERGSGWPTSYSVSKGALNALTRVLAKELAPAGVRVNAVCPGWVRTRMGGSGAPRTIEEGGAGIVWAATLPPGGPSGGVFRDGEPVTP